MRFLNQQIRQCPVHRSFSTRVPLLHVLVISTLQVKILRNQSRCFFLVCVPIFPRLFLRIQWACFPETQCSRVSTQEVEAAVQGQVKAGAGGEEAAGRRRRRCVRRRLRREAGQEEQGRHARPRCDLQREGSGERMRGQPGSNMGGESQRPWCDCSGGGLEKRGGCGGGGTQSVPSAPRATPGDKDPGRWGCGDQRIQVFGRGGGTPNEREQADPVEMRGG